MKTPLAGLTENELKEILTAEYSAPSFRAKQVFSWVQKGVEPSEMRNLPAEFKQSLSEKYVTNALSLITKREEASTNTIKLLQRTADALLIETVLLSYSDELSVCVSTQAGCKMHCSFCVSGKDGFFRNLTKAEMVSQILSAMRLAEKPVSNIVLMGSGEPLDNYDETLSFIRFLTSEQGFNMSPRRITLSTCGITPKIYKLIEDNVGVNLSISLHCAVSETRAKMMPVEKAYPIKEVMAAAHEYRKVSKRRLTLEYCLIENTNDTSEYIKALKELTAGTDDLVNIINVNEGSGAYAKNSIEAADRFLKKLKKEKIEATIRRRLGSSINAACGQLRSGYLNKNDK